MFNLSGVRLYIQINCFRAQIYVVAVLTHGQENVNNFIVTHEIAIWYTLYVADFIQDVTYKIPSTYNVFCYAS